MSAPTILYTVECDSMKVGSWFRKVTSSVIGLVVLFSQLQVCVLFRVNGVSVIHLLVHVSDHSPLVGAKGAIRNVAFCPMADVRFLRPRMNNVAAACLHYFSLFDNSPATRASLSLSKQRGLSMTKAGLAGQIVRFNSLGDCNKPLKIVRIEL